MIHIKDKLTFKKQVLDEKKKPVLVDFYAEWCGPCKMMSPILEQLEKDNTEVKIVKVNVDEAQELAMQYEVMSIPTIYIFKQGKPIGSPLMGVQSKESLEGLLN